MKPLDYRRLQNSSQHIYIENVDSYVLVLMTFAGFLS